LTSRKPIREVSLGSSGKIMNVPNLLTLFRLFLIPVFIIVFFSSLSNSLLWGTLIFLLAGFTDILDGYIARKYKIVTKWGTAMDPLADKLMLLVVLSCLVIKQYIPLWILIVVATKDILMIISATFLYREGSVISANKFGKLSTLLFYISILTLTFDNVLGSYMLYASVISTLIALTSYGTIYIKNRNKYKT
jgi:cardiolipin synthase